MTSDRKPSDMLTLEDRLKTRFEWGLLADIQPPDYETRMAILKNKAISLGLDLGDDVCNYIANNITNNVRQIEGTVKKILAYRDLNDMPLDLPNVSRAINDMFKVEGNAVPTRPSSSARLAGSIPLTNPSCAAPSKIKARQRHGGLPCI